MRNCQNSEDCIFYPFCQAVGCCLGDKNEEMPVINWESVDKWLEKHPSKAPEPSQRRSDDGIGSIRVGGSKDD